MKFIEDRPPILIREIHNRTLYVQKNARLPSVGSAAAIESLSIKAIARAGKTRNEILVLSAQRQTNF